MLIEFWLRLRLAILGASVLYLLLMARDLTNSELMFTICIIILLFIILI